MITVEDIKKKLKTFVRPIAINTMKKLCVFLEMDMPAQKTWIGEVYRVYQRLDGTFREVKIGTNNVILSGLMNLAFLLYHIPAKVQMPFFEDQLWATADVDERPNCTYDATAEPWIQGFNVCTDGVQGIDVIPYPRHKNGYTFDTLVPFRVIPLSENDYEIYRPKYYHSRQITIGDRKYIAYYSKKMEVTYRAKLDNDTDIPQNPNDNLTTDRDSRLVAEFSVNIDEDELVEWFRLTQEGGPESTSYSAILTMIGKSGKWHPKEHPDQSYDTVMECQVFSRCNHASVPHGVDGQVLVKYRMMHI